MMHRTRVPPPQIGLRQEDHIAFSLMRALLVSRGHIRCERMPVGMLAKQNES
jgi:hypothetical protein